MGIASGLIASNWKELGLLAAGLLAITFLGRRFGEGATGLSQGISALLSPQITPRIQPTFGLGFGITDLQGRAIQGGDLWGWLTNPTVGGSGGGGQSNGRGAGAGYNVVSIAEKTNQVVTPGSRETSDISNFKYKGLTGQAAYNAKAAGF